MAFVWGHKTPRQGFMGLTYRFYGVTVGRFGFGAFVAEVQGGKSDE